MTIKLDTLVALLRPAAVYAAEAVGYDGTVYLEADQERFSIVLEADGRRYEVCDRVDVIGNLYKAEFSTRVRELLLAAPPPRKKRRRRKAA